MVHTGNDNDMETTKNIQGYLECDGTITKISSWEDIEQLMIKYEKSKTEISEAELDELTTKEDEVQQDDCGIGYLSNPTILKYGPRKHGGYSPLESYKVKDNTIAISDCAFDPGKGDYACLQAISMPDSLLVIGNRSFYYNQFLSLVSLSNSLIKIGDYAFYHCLHLSIITFPKSLKIIGSGSFGGCSFSSLSIPASVTTIRSHAFSECHDLKKIEFKGIPTIIGSGIFDKCEKIEQIIVPQGYKNYFTKALFPINEIKIIEKEVS